jgi:hypothetical protein
MEKMLNACQPKRIRVLTRFNIDQFVRGVNSLDALELLLNEGALIRGVKKLHSKLYIYDKQSAIITSANLTDMAWYKNSEFGVELTDKVNVGVCRAYFNELWRKTKVNLSQSKLNKWKNEVSKARSIIQNHGSSSRLADYGENIGFELPEAEIEQNYVSAQHYFVKFFGRSSDRYSRQDTVFNFIDSSGSHFACTYPAGNRRPRKPKDGDVMYLAAIVSDPNDIIIVGQAIAETHNDAKDVASRKEIDRRPWKKNWPFYIRVHDAKYIDGIIDNGVSLYKMINQKGAVVFESSKKRLLNGECDVNPFTAYIKRPDVNLSIEGNRWIDSQ